MVRGGTVFGIYPFSRYRRNELSGGLVQFKEEYDDSSLQTSSARAPADNFGRSVFRNGSSMPLGVALWSRRRRSFANTGRSAGTRCCRTMRRRKSGASCRVRRSTSTRVITGASAAPACSRCARARIQELGPRPDFLYFGGNSEMRGYDYLQFVGAQGVLCERRTALPADRGHADAARHSRRHPRRVLCEPRRGGARAGVLARRANKNLDALISSITKMAHRSIR